MKKAIVAMLIGMIIAVPVSADATFDRIIEIDNQVNQLLSERDGLISSKTDTSALPAFETTYMDGQYKIGEEIPAGEYVFFASGKYGGSIKESTDSNGSDKVDSEYFDYNLIYTITEGNYIEISDAIAVPSEQVTSLVINKGSGMFKVGTHIPAGEYRLIPTSYTSSGTCRIFSSSKLWDKASRIDTDYFSSATYITLHDGEYIDIDNALFIQ